MDNTKEFHFIRHIEDIVAYMKEYMDTKNMDGLMLTTIWKLMITSEQYLKKKMPEYSLYIKKQGDYVSVENFFDFNSWTDSLKSSILPE